ncbi:MAG: helix-turn-helix domain-containing protein [Desulfurellales bacterium]|nr:MAG: helix-turn-helix domain-containing protein [Desulfurellales bacterium]
MRRVPEDFDGDGYREEQPRVTVEGPDYRFAMVPDELIRDRDVSGNEVRVWALLARYGGTADRAYPGHKRLARDLGLAESSIRKMISGLEAAGWRRAENRFASDGRQITNKYVLNTHKRVERPTSGPK